MTLLDRIEARLVADWRHAWRWSSVRLALIAGALAGWAASDPTGFQRAVDMLPEWARPMVGVIVALAPIISRVTTKKGHG